MLFVPPDGRPIAALAVACRERCPRRAQSPADFYKGKTIEVYIGTSVGGGYDAYTRILSRHMGKYIPGNPVLVPKNMAGGGGIRLANFLYNAAPKDGPGVRDHQPRDSVRAAARQQGRAVRRHPLSTGSAAPTTKSSICVAWHTTGVERYQQVLERELVVGASGIGADTYQFPKVANGVLGTKFKVVTGYPGGNDIDLAMERQEVQGRCGWSWSSVKATHPTWLPEKKIQHRCSRWACPSTPSCRTRR